MEDIKNTIEKSIIIEFKNIFGLKNKGFKLNKNGRVITFGYHSISMGKSRGFSQEKILLMSHGGAIHDTIAVIERKTINK